MVFSLIKHIRRQSKSSRDTIAFSIAVGFTAIVALVWVVQVPGQAIQNIPDNTIDASAFSTLFSGVSDQFSQMQASVSNAASTTARGVASSDQVVDTTLRAEELKQFSSLATTTSSSTVPGLVQAVPGQIVRIATTSSVTPDPM